MALSYGLADGSSKQGTGNTLSCRSRPNRGRYQEGELPCLTRL
jgi:hypothetical protein